jgi:uncharacterized protein (TIGR03435 family)
MGAFVQPGGRFGAQNVPPRFLIRTAYDVKDFQIISSGSSSWIDAERHDITAKAPDGTANGFEPMHSMLQSLPADRFSADSRKESFSANASTWARAVSENRKLLLCR